MQSLGRLRLWNDTFPTVKANPGITSQFASDVISARLCAITMYAVTAGLWRRVDTRNKMSHQRKSHKIWSNGNEASCQISAFNFNIHLRFLLYAIRLMILLSHFNSFAFLILYKIFQKRRHGCSVESSYFLNVDEKQPRWTLIGHHLTFFPPILFYFENVYIWKINIDPLCKYKM